MQQKARIEARESLLSASRVSVGMHPDSDGGRRLRSEWSREAGLGATSQAQKQRRQPTMPADLAAMGIGFRGPEPARG